MIWIWIGVAIVVFLVGQMIHLATVMAWEDQQTVGLGYFGRSREDRASFKSALGLQARLLTPIMAVLGRTTKFTFEKASFEHEGLPGPRGTCNEDSFAAGMGYAPQPEDVFIVTQMKCGTTWMQHLVYEIAMGGDGDLVDTGKALYAVSPWLEARKSVPIDASDVVGHARPSRVIKTHLPHSHCPFDAQARYVYVARHPVSCFASCVDFIRANAGPLQPKAEDLEYWFTSDHMWWGSWPRHVAGWWKAARDHDNVLFVTFEDMKADLPAVIERVAAFLGSDPLSSEQIERIAHKCSFEYMRDHKDVFEMHPPHLFAVDGQMFVRGTADRHKDVESDVREGILTWSQEELEAAGLPKGELYAD